MTAGKTRTLDPIEWLPAERFALRLVDQWTGLLSDAHKSALRSPV